MKIWVNQKEHQCASNSTTLLQLLEELDKATKTGIAVAINNKIITKSAWSNTSIVADDKITIITATQGG